MRPNSLPLSPHLALFGTASDVGKSLMCAAVGRLLRQQGFSVAPFKAQNMSNNAYVTADGGEIGRAQYVQALACGVEPSVDHNPVLLKPSADNLSQVVVHGRVVGQARALDYYRDNGPLKRAAYASLDRLVQRHEVVLLEGAGSCAEVNLRSCEFVNFPAAHHCNARVILIGDIDRGGVFAQIVGSLEIMPPEDRARVAGILINKFRGDVQLFNDGVRYLEARTGLPVLGVVPFLYGLDLDAEDAVPLSMLVDPPPGTNTDQIRIGVLRLPHISNFTDFNALARVDGVAVHYLYRAREFADYAAAVVPGSKSVIQDLHWMRDVGLADALLAYHYAGGKILGICGGFQMLGLQVADPQGVEGSVANASGLGLLNATTQLQPEKVVRQTVGVVASEEFVVSGYEIHCGRTVVHGHPPLLRLENQIRDGVRLDAVWATYLHGLFDDAAFRQLFLHWVAPGRPFTDTGRGHQAWLDAELDRFADHVRGHLDWRRIMEWAKV